MGPAGLNALFQTHAREINEQIANPVHAVTPEWKRLSAVLDAVSQQKDSYLSGLYWYTDIDQAKAAARASGKPILSLRLLGKLNEEFSFYSNLNKSQSGRCCAPGYWFSLESARGFELYRMLAAGRASVLPSGTMQNYYRTERGSAGC